MKVTTSDERRDYCCLIHVPAGPVLPTNNACGALSPQSVNNLTQHHYDLIRQKDR
jgi:hypothetical protein